MTMKPYLLIYSEGPDLISTHKLGILQLFYIHGSATKIVFMTICLILKFEAKRDARKILIIHTM